MNIGKFVICFDNCDVGCFVIYEFGILNYLVIDMVEDVIGVLDVYYIDKVYLFGMLLGGMIV